MINDFFVNNILAGTSTADFVPNAQRVARIGAGSTHMPVPDDFFKGDIGEILLYDYILSGMEIAIVENYLSRWD